MTRGFQHSPSVGAGSQDGEDRARRAGCADTGARQEDQGDPRGWRGCLGSQTWAQARLRAEGTPPCRLGEQNQSLPDAAHQRRAFSGKTS